MKLRAVILVIILIAAATAIAFFRKLEEPKNVDGSASISEVVPQMPEKPEYPTVSKPKPPELDGFYGIEDELEALPGSM